LVIFDQSSFFHRLMTGVHILTPRLDIGVFGNFIKETLLIGNPSINCVFVVIVIGECRMNF